MCFHNDYTLEVRYLGTKGVHLPAQSQINMGPPVRPALNIPTFMSMPSAQTLAALPHTTNDLYNVDSVLPAWQANFDNGPITSYLFRGNSIYHGLAVEFTRRFSKGLLFKTAYTWSHNIDDSTADRYPRCCRRAVLRILPTCGRSGRRPSWIAGIV